jgi:hypothetical protein
MAAAKAYFEMRFAGLASRLSFVSSEYLPAKQFMISSDVIPLWRLQALQIVRGVKQTKRYTEPACTVPGQPEPARKIVLNTKDFHRSFSGDGLVNRFTRAAKRFQLSLQVAEAVAATTRDLDHL